MESIKALVLKYYESWQNQDWNRMRECLSDNFFLDSGHLQFNNAEDFQAFCKEGPKWSDVKLIRSIFNDSHASLLYEGISLDGQKIRVGEFLSVEDGKITESQALISFI